ncbi:putative LigA protein [Trichinella spiralis]|uniref:putative LigA protein n=1 Tax=Trichinella spiralis TaxID=6334 RepID=UPI0001EFDF90|nr:putative LigA protein [Trichinella spiralis]
MSNCKSEKLDEEEEEKTTITTVIMGRLIEMMRTLSLLFAGSKAEQQSSGGTTLAMRRRTATTPPPRDADPILEPDPDADLDVDHDRATEAGKDNGRKKRWLSRGSVESGRRDVEPALERPVVVDVRGKRASFDVVTADSLGIVDSGPSGRGPRNARSPLGAAPNPARHRHQLRAVRVAVQAAGRGPARQEGRQSGAGQGAPRASQSHGRQGRHRRRFGRRGPLRSAEQGVFVRAGPVARGTLPRAEEADQTGARVQIYGQLDRGRRAPGGGGRGPRFGQGAEFRRPLRSELLSQLRQRPPERHGDRIAQRRRDRPPRPVAVHGRFRRLSDRRPGLQRLGTFHSNNYHSPLSAATLDSRWSPSPSSRGDFHFDDLTLGLEPLQTRRYQHRPGQQLLLFDCSEPTTPRPFNNRCPSPNFYRNRQKLQVETRPVYTPTAWEERFLGGLGDQWDDGQRVSMARRPLYYGNSLPEWPAESDADSISAGGPVDSESWLDLQMQKLKIRREVNDPARRRRREQERLLLEELKQVQHVDGGRGRFGRQGAVAGAVAGSKGAPLMDESTASAVSSISNSSPGRANEESHTITITNNNSTTTTTPPHPGFTRRKTNNANTTIPTSDRDTSPLLDVQSTVGRNRDGLWSSSSSSHRHACYNPHQTNFDHCYYYSNTLSSTKSASSPKSILKKPKSFPAQPFVSPSYQATEELQSGNYYHDQGEHHHHHQLLIPVFSTALIHHLI